MQQLKLMKQSKLLVHVPLPLPQTKTLNYTRHTNMQFHSSLQAQQDTAVSSANNLPNYPTTLPTRASILNPYPCLCRQHLRQHLQVHTTLHSSNITGPKPWLGRITTFPFINYKGIQGLNPCGKEMQPICTIMACHGTR